jgi:hypothetical protein
VPGKGVPHQWRPVRNRGSPPGRPPIANLTSHYLLKPMILTYIRDIPEVRIVDLGDLTYNFRRHAHKPRNSAVLCANRLGLFPSVIKVTVSCRVSLTGEGRF